MIDWIPYPVLKLAALCRTWLNALTSEEAQATWHWDAALCKEAADRIMPFMEAEIPGLIQLSVQTFKTITTIRKGKEMKHSGSMTRARAASMDRHMPCKSAPITILWQISSKWQGKTAAR